MCLRVRRSRGGRAASGGLWCDFEAIRTSRAVSNARRRHRRADGVGGTRAVAAPRRWRIDTGRVLLDVVERVLRDVPNSRIGMLPHGTGSGLDLARQTFDQCGFARAVRPDASDTTGEGHLDRSFFNRNFLVPRVLEGHVDDLDEGLALGLDACAENVSC